MIENANPIGAALGDDIGEEHYYTDAMVMFAICIAGERVWLKTTNPG